MNQTFCHYEEASFLKIDLGMNIYFLIDITQTVCAFLQVSCLSINSFTTSNLQLHFSFTSVYNNFSLLNFYPFHCKIYPFFLKRIIFH